MNLQLANNWQRHCFEQTPIYINPDSPDWFIPNQAADRLLQSESIKKEDNKYLNTLVKRLTATPGKSYTQRTEILTLDRLTECWIHITNRCNLACTHCMFCSSPQAHDELSLDTILQVIQEAYTLGTRIFYFTGGEPLLSPSFFPSVHMILEKPDTHVVLLTNLTLIRKVYEQIQALPKERLHFQVSIDGIEQNHDAIRGIGAFKKLTENLNLLHSLDFPITLSMSVTQDTQADMEKVIAFAAHHRISHCHFLWLFHKGNAAHASHVSSSSIFPHLVAAQQRALENGVLIDNIEIIRSQVFSCPGTRYDLNNAAWQSLALGPDGYIYPSPALVYSQDMKCGAIQEGLENIWRHSPVLKTLRQASLHDCKEYSENPFKYLIGGGDIDHSFLCKGKITGGDPYVDLYTAIAQWLMVTEAQSYPSRMFPALKLKMGEKLGECPTRGNSLFFTHSNCVLTLPGHDTHSLVNQYYDDAAKEVKEDILNPICYEESLIAHIPEAMRYRSYGCGSPVIEASIRPHETIVDLGSGTGIECFIAAKLTGSRGQVMGIDMGDTMLSLSHKTKLAVVKNLGYDNLDFKKALLEHLPLDNNSVHVVISNCVINLSPDKRKVFEEIYRSLKPGGRLVISDITFAEDIPLSIKYNEKLRGECIGGALSYHDLFGLLNDTGFTRSTILKAYVYRTIENFTFYSITYQAFKPNDSEKQEINELQDFQTIFSRVESQPTCCTFKPTKPANQPGSKKSQPGCLLCGEELVYLDTNIMKECIYCHQVHSVHTHCDKGHYICDQCHSADALTVLKNICLGNRETNAITLMKTIRSHPSFNVHGPEHHSLVPAVILTALRNNGESITRDQIIAGIERGHTVPGGSCAFLGICGAAIGVGIAFAILREANPYKGEERQMVQKVTNRVLEKIAAMQAPRCCQRDAWIALQEGALLLKEKMQKKLNVKGYFTCEQYRDNKECIYDQCPLFVSC